MHTSVQNSSEIKRKFAPFDLSKLLTTTFAPKQGERICILIDLEDPKQITDFAFLKNSKLKIQEKAYKLFYEKIRNDLVKTFGLKACDIFAYKLTGGSNLELPDTAVNPKGQTVEFSKDIYSKYDIILCISTYSATAPLTAHAKEYGFRGGTFHGLNEIVLNSGLAVDYNEVSRQTEKLRQGMTRADSVDIDFRVDKNTYNLHIELEGQEAQKSHGICRISPDIANLPAGEVYFVPRNAQGCFPIKFDDGTLGAMEVQNGRVQKVKLIRGNQETIRAVEEKIKQDPAAGILGELGFGTQVLPFSGADIQDEKIFGTFHLATGRNDHLKGPVTLQKFKVGQNATHDDILFSPDKTPEIIVDQVRMRREGKTIVLIENYKPTNYLWNLLA